MSRFAFRPARYERQIAPLVRELLALDEVDPATLQRLLRRHPKDGRGLFAKSEIVRAFRHLRRKHGWDVDEEGFVERLRMKPIRTLSGVAPVTVLTKPFPCPGECIFCPSDVRMPKSYLSDEPGAQRAAQHRFDPYSQTLSRLFAYHHNGHRVDKVELIVLGGTWSSYPQGYQRWFVTRCLEALNDFDPERRDRTHWRADGPDYAAVAETVDGRSLNRTYNRIVSDLGERLGDRDEEAAWSAVEAAQRRNEGAIARCVGLVLETRPDRLDLDEAVRMRRLGATKVQLGLQSLDDRVLALNRRGHDLAASRRAMTILRRVGFKIHAHWMPNLLGSSPARDLADFRRLFKDPHFRPDELKIYPCSLIESAELMAYYEDGRWRPYEHDELLEVLTGCLRSTPEYCRLTRVIRDIPGTDIVAGNRRTNFRQLAEEELARRGERSRDIRAREIGERPLGTSVVELRRLDYGSIGGREVFLQAVTPSDRLLGFLRLTLPAAAGPLPELAGRALLREVHVYGMLVGLGHRRGGRSQHRGLGRRLVAWAARIARRSGFTHLTVISGIGTRAYYRRLGFVDGELYQHLPLQGLAEEP